VLNLAICGDSYCHNGMFRVLTAWLRAFSIQGKKFPFSIAVVGMALENFQDPLAWNGMEPNTTDLAKKTTG